MSSNWLENIAPANNTITNTANFSRSLNSDQSSYLTSDTSVAGLVFSQPNNTLISSDSNVSKVLTIGAHGINNANGNTTIGSLTNLLSYRVNSQLWLNNTIGALTILGAVENIAENHATLIISSNRNDGGGSNIVLSGPFKDNIDGGSLGIRYVIRSGNLNPITIPAGNSYSGNTTIINGKYNLSDSQPFGSAQGLLQISNGRLVSSMDTIINNRTTLTNNAGAITLEGTGSYTFGNNFEINNTLIRLTNLLSSDKSINITGPFIRGSQGSITSSNGPIFDGTGNCNISGSFYNNNLSIETLRWNSAGVLTLSGINTISRWNILGQKGIVILQNPNTYYHANNALGLTDPCTLVCNFPISQDLINRTTTNSTGDIALTSDSSLNLTWNRNCSLGAYGANPITFSGSISTNTGNYRFGGGGGTLIINTPPLTGNNGLIIGGSLNGLGGKVIMLNTNDSYCGNIQINGIFETSDCFGSASCTNPINMNRNSEIKYVGSGCTTNRSINLIGQSPLVLHVPQTVVEANSDCYAENISWVATSGADAWADKTLILSEPSVLDNTITNIPN